ncbi:unnamed protein product, partial [Ixodes hexagonus]
STPGISQRIITDVQDQGHRLVEIFQDSNGTVLHCTSLGSKNIIDEVLKDIPKDMVTTVTKDGMQPFLDLCNSQHQLIKGRSMLENWPKFTSYTARSFKKVMMYPGTNWCGAGNMANNYDDLGPHRDTDMCCRDHDHATDSIASQQTEHGVTNGMFYTIAKYAEVAKKVGTLLNKAKYTIFPTGTMGRCGASRIVINGVSNGVSNQPCLQWTNDTLRRKVWKLYKPDTSEPKKWRIHSSTGFGEKEQPRDCEQYTNHTS